MILKPSENTQLFGMNNFFNEIIKLYKEKKMPTKILLSGKKGLGKSTMAYHIINYILSGNEDFKYNLNEFIINSENKSFQLIQNNTHPNFYLVDILSEKKNIDINQIREMITFTNKSTFNNMPKFILIDNIEYLSKNSINALLKVIEEPNDNIFFILISNSEKPILSTLISRCLIFKINFTFNHSMYVCNKIINENVFDVINYDLISYYNTPGEIVNLINFSRDKDIDLKNYTLTNFLNLLIENGYYKKNKNVKNLLINFIELFFLKEYKVNNSKTLLLKFFITLLTKFIIQKNLTLMKKVYF